MEAIGPEGQRYEISYSQILQEKNYKAIRANNVLLVILVILFVLFLIGIIAVLFSSVVSNSLHPLVCGGL